MNTGLDKLLVRAEEQAEIAGEEATELDSALVELGKVSDTQGGWVGTKMDSGAGLMYF